MNVQMTKHEDKKAEQFICLVSLDSLGYGESNPGLLSALSHQMVKMRVNDVTATPYPMETGCGSDEGLLAWKALFSPYETQSSRSVCGAGFLRDLGPSSRVDLERCMKVEKKKACDFSASYSAPHHHHQLPATPHKITQFSKMPQQHPMARWPSGPRRHVKEFQPLIVPTDPVVPWSRKGREFESHPCQLRFCLSGMYLFSSTALDSSRCC
ncbi:hypothetical protein VTK26DRAFT_1305 [Humicola hyalothermophila]